MSFTCAHCRSTYTRKNDVKRHILKHHAPEKDNSKNTSVKMQTRKILCSLCDLDFNTNSRYHQHLKFDHNVSLNKEILKFSNVEEFRNWKTNFERETVSTFVQTTSAKKMKNESLTYYFFCHRSFLGKKHKHKTDNKRKRAGTNKIKKSCPAMMKAVVENGAVEVEFCSTHLGHKCDIGRLRLTIEDRNLLAGKLSAGLPLRRILTDIRHNIPSAKLDRIHYTDMTDLYNIKRAYGITCPHRYDNNDSNSVESWIKEKDELPKADNPVLFYKDQSSNYGNFEKFDFILILMTKFQKQRLVQFGEKVICVDRTHELNDYDIQLFTILVHDEYNEGIPVAFCFSNKSTKELYTLFFTEVKKAINESIAPNVFMSDGEMAFYDAWIDVMSPATHLLICRWHLNRIWVANLNKITCAEKRSLVLQTLNSLMMEEDPDNFTVSLHQFLIRLRSDDDTANFYNYFIENYVDNVQIWAQCYRKDVPIHTNMGLEALHKNIKYKYLNGIRSIRLDKTIHALMCLIQDKEFGKMIKSAKQKPSKKLAQINKSHEESVECDSNVEEVEEEKWTITSCNNHSQRYEVNLIKYEPCCAHICEKCNICLHMLTCSCYDYSVKQNICKHIHAVMRLKNNDVSQEEFQEIVFDPVLEQNNSLKETKFHPEQKEIENSRLMEKFSVIFSALEKATLNSEQRSKILEHLDAIGAEISISSKEKLQPQIFHNKNVLYLY